MKPLFAKPELSHPLLRHPRGYRKQRRTDF